MTTDIEAQPSDAKAMEDRAKLLLEKLGWALSDTSDKWYYEPNYKLDGWRL